MTIRLDGRVAIVTGAGGGLGRSHALLLARRGARIVVNDLGGSLDGGGASSSAAEAVVAEIRAAGGEAIADGASVTDAAAVEAMVARAMDQWGRVDILINNAGVLRDRSFAKMTLDDFRFVLDVHLMGAVNCTKAVWDVMRAQQYGRIVFTTSSTGLYGNFGQSNYGTAKMALVGLMQTLAIEGARYGIRVNCIAPTGATRMTADIMPPEHLELLKPEAVSVGVALLVSEAAPTRAILCAGAGSFERAYVTLTEGEFIGHGETAPERLADRFDAISDRVGDTVPESGAVQTARELDHARAALEKV
jgi:NAD(P)-dependent dehydrogenase (short-subunit alcohol dehydrogenase family)